MLLFYIYAERCCCFCWLNELRIFAQYCHCIFLKSLFIWSWVFFIRPWRTRTEERPTLSKHCNKKTCSRLSKSASERGECASVALLYFLFWLSTSQQKVGHRLTEVKYEAAVCWLARLQEACCRGDVKHRVPVWHLFPASLAGRPFSCQSDGALFCLSHLAAVRARSPCQVCQFNCSVTPSSPPSPTGNQKNSDDVPIAWLHAQNNETLRDKIRQDRFLRRQLLC